MITKNGIHLDSLDLWAKHAAPKSRIQWKAGRSAVECARAWLSRDVQEEWPAEIAAVVRSNAAFGEISTWSAEPECRVAIDQYSGPANIDVLVSAHDAFGPLAMAIEAKADESFGPSLGQAFASALERRISSPGSKGLARLEELAAAILPPATDAAPPAVALRYQLLTATAAALAHAREIGATRAIVMIHEFQSPRTASNNLARNRADLIAFLRRMGFANADEISDGRLLGPVTIRESSLFPAPAALFFGKAIRRIDAVVEI